MRIQSIDFIKGIDIIAMVLFNYSVTLSYFNVIRMPDDFLYWFVLPRVIAGIFIILSGFSAYASYSNRKKGFTKRYFIRGLKLSLFALLITAATYLAVPQGTIFFGIIHFFAASSFLVPLLIRHPKLNLAAGIMITLIGFYLQLSQFNTGYLFWLGLIPKNFSALDSFPLMPWLGVLMLSLYFSKYSLGRSSKVKLKTVSSKVFMFLGKHSLTIYLIHQPLLFLLLLGMGFSLHA